MGRVPELHRIRGASRALAIDAQNAPRSMATFGDEIALGGADGTVRLFHARTGTLTRTFATRGGAVCAMAHTAVGPRLALGCEDGSVHLWPAPSGDIDLALSVHKAPVRAVAIAVDGQRYLSGGDDHQVRLFEARTPKVICARQVGSALLGVRQAVFGAERLQLALTHAGVAVVWEGPTEHELVTFPVTDEKLLAGRYEAFAASPDRRLMAAARHDGTVVLFRIDEPVCRLEGHDGVVTSAAFSPHGRWLVTGGEDCTARIWDTTSTEPVCALEHASPVRQVAFLPDGAHVVSAVDEGALAVWQLHADGYELGDALTEAHAVVRGEPSSLWPSTKSAVGVDFLLDVWSDLRQRAQHAQLPEHLLAAARDLRDALLDLLALLSEGEHPHLPGHGLDRYKHPLFRAALVDPGLATELCLRMGGDPLGVARVELLRSSLSITPSDPRLATPSSSRIPR